ncbi:MAG: methyltransferase [Desulfobacterales bacterium]|jgi:protein-S-isoprenylcysteine O-methyltransferase Ste14
MVDNVVKRIHEIFNNKTIRYVLLKLRYPIFLIAVIILILNINPAWFAVGCIVAFFGELIQLWCFASLDKNKMLAVKGPYVLMRNPMYIGRFFLLLGVLLLLGNGWILFMFTVVYYFYMVNRVKREEAKLQPLFGEPYKRYCQKVNRFVPSLRAVDWESLWFFRWNLLFQNNGHWNFLSMLVCFFIFYCFTFIYSTS